MNAFMRSTTSSRWLWGGAIGLALGTFYTASPLTVWFFVVMTGLFVWAGRGLIGRERRYVWGILAVAVAIRVLAIAVLFLGTQHDQMVSFFWDGDGVYLKYRSLVIRDVWMGIPVSRVDFFNAFMPYYGWSSLIHIFAYVQFLTGPARYGVHLLNVAMFVASALILHRLIRSAYGRAPALIGLVLMLFLPTLVAWSVSALKESLCVLLFAAGLRAAVAAGRRAAPIRQRVFGSAVLAAAIAAADTVRPGVSLIMIGGFSAGGIGSHVVRRLGLVLLVSICLPLAAIQLWEHPRVQSTIMARLKSAATLHRASFLGDGYSYALLDRRFYSHYPIDPKNETSVVTIPTMTPDEGLRFAVRALTNFLVAPLPWQMSPRLSVVLLPQQIIWYGLVMLACVGFVAGLRRDALVTCMLVGLFVAGWVAVAPNSGNIGTMVRFRDLIVPSVVWLSALGATSIASRIMSRGALSPGETPCL
jgi:hypothetical protein